MYTPDWKLTRERLREICRKAENESDQDRALLFQTLEGMGDQLENFRERIVQLEEQVQSLTRRTLTLESRIHEEVE